VTDDDVIEIIRTAIDQVTFLVFYFKEWLDRFFPGRESFPCSKGSESPRGLEVVSLAINPASHHLSSVGGGFPSLCRALFYLIACFSHSISKSCIFNSAADIFSCFLRGILDGY